MTNKIATLALAAAMLSFYACSEKEKPAAQETAAPEEIAANSVSPIPVAEARYFGDSISQEGAKPADDVVAGLKGDTVDAKVYGEVLSSCQNKGCWMKVKLANSDKPLHVMFKDYGFFVPTENLAGKKVVLDGRAFVDTTGVADLQHYAHDAGKTEAEIEKITQPEVTPNFIARGVVLQK